MIKNALILVPHQDDELNISGFLLETMINNNIEVNILYTTKGNYYKEKEKWRQKERDKIINKIYGGKIKYIQLDYDDDYHKENHSYKNDAIRNSMKHQIKKCITDILADLIICVDYDDHPDHLMLASLFDSIIPEILVDYNYHPIVLKKGAYLGVWNGKDDYFDKRPKRTCEGMNDNKKYLLSLPNTWEDRICLRTDYIDHGLTFWKSKIYKAYRCYLSQCGFKYFFKASNTDITYWFRNTNNLMLSAKVQSNTGEAYYINDFSIGRITDIGESNSLNKFSRSAWVPTDTQKEITIEWKNKKNIDTMKIYQNFYRFGHINKFELIFDNGTKRIMQCNELDVQDFKLNLVQVQKIRLRIIDYSGAAGIRELELYEDSGTFPWNEIPFQKFNEKDVCSRNVLMILLAKLIRHHIWIVLRAKNKIRRHLHLSHW